MTKDEFLAEFHKLNMQIESAVAAQDFGRVSMIDMARRQMLEQFASTSVPDGDREFFEILEQCAADNAKAITEMTSQMGRHHRQTGHRIRGLMAYGPANQ